MWYKLKKIVVNIILGYVYLWVGYKLYIFFCSFGDGIREVSKCESHISIVLPVILLATIFLRKYLYFRTRNPESDTIIGKNGKKNFEVFIKNTIKLTGLFLFGIIGLFILGAILINGEGGLVLILLIPPFVIAGGLLILELLVWFFYTLFNSNSDSSQDN